MPKTCQDFSSEKSAAIQAAPFCILRDPVEMAATEMEATALAEYLRRVMMENGLTNEAVQNQSRKRGGSIGKSTVDQLLQSKTANPGIYTLQDLALGIGRPVEEVVFAALGVPLADTSAFRKSEFANLWEMYRQLPPAEQRVFKRLLDMFYRELSRSIESQ